MYDNYNYPVGADTPNAPWNQEDVPNMDFEVTCSQTLSKTVTVTTNNYVPEASGVDYEPDTSDTNWAEEYYDNDHYTPIQLIELFKQCLEENLKNGLVFKTPGVTKRLIEECEGWTEDETEFVEE